jgi:RHS repeat-associated protein
MEYDPLNRLVKIIQPNPQFPGDDGPITRQEYDLLGNVVKTIDPLGNATNYRYDNFNRKISETNAEGGVTTFTYHEDGQMKSLTDPVGNTTSWTYNLFGRVSREMVTLDKKMRTRYFYYDVTGNITIKVDRNNRVTSWTYDKLNRPTSEVWHDTWRSFHENKQPIKKFTTTYNHSGKIASTEDGDNKFTFAYGIFGNEIKQTQNLADLEKPIEFNFTTDTNGLKTEKILKVADKIDHVNKYEVDALNRISKISQVIGDNEIKSVDIQYDDLGQLVKQTRFDSGKEIIATINKYDLAGRLVNISHTGNNKTIYADYDLKWDNANRITDFDFTYLNGPEKRSESKYRYDKTAQLINASYNFMQHEKYDFDLNGNRKQAEIQGQKQSYKTGEYNRLLSDENYSYEYDLEGNRISKTDKEGKTTKYTWDNRNRLVKVSTPTNEIEYWYDYLNRLVKRIDNKTNQQYFVHDNWQIILQFNNKESIPIHRYLWGTKQDELICNNNNWALGDHLNTIRDIVKSDGTVADHLDYNSFGKLISVTKNTDSTYFAYTGKLIDNDSKLQWNINRWYDSNVGKWVSEDPIGFDGNDVNLNRYVLSNPINQIDINGFEVVPPNEVIFPGNYKISDIKSMGRDEMTAYIKRYIKNDSNRDSLLRQIRNALPKSARSTWITAEKYAQIRNIAKRIGGGFIIFLSLYEIADAAETSLYWRHPGYIGEKCAKCECALFARTVIVPTWWNLFGDFEYGSTIRIDNWDDYGVVSNKECLAYESDIGGVEIGSSTGYIVYEYYYILCRFGGKN